MASETPTTVGDSERRRLVAIISGVLAGVFAAGLLDGFLSIGRTTSPDPTTDVMVSLMLHMAVGVMVLPAAAVVAYGWMPLRWWLKTEWRKPSVARMVLVVVAVAVVTGCAGWAFVWQRGIEVSAIDYKPLGMPAAGLVLGVSVYRIAMGLGQWKVFVPLLAASVGLVGWFISNIDQTGIAIERLSFDGYSSKVFSKQLRKLADGDGDGFPRMFCAEACDCDDARGEVSPVAVEIPDNGLDDDCTEGDLVLPDEPVVVRKPEPEPPTQAEEKPPSLERPNILLITIDTLRADHLGMYGYERNTSPNMDKLAGEGVVFKEARAQGPMTCFSVPVLMTGRYYSELKRSTGKWPQMHKDNVLMSEIFLEAGYHTAAFHSIGYFVPLFQFDQGFLYYDASTVREREPTHWHPTSDMITDKTLKYFDESIATLPANKPWFVWAYYGDPHSGYIRHRDLPSFGPTYPDIYDQEILFTDLHIGRLLDGLRERQELETSIVIITSDHGEGLVKEEDHGYQYHGQHLHDNLLRVPLVFWGSPITKGVFNEPVGNIDVLPTLLELAGLEASPELELRGESLKPFLEGRRMKRGPTFAEKTIENGVPEKAMIKWPWKIIWKLGVNRFTLYNIESDPGELVEASEDHPEVFAQMKKDIQIWRATVLKERPAGRY